MPFPVRRPTFTEVKRVHSKLSTIYHPSLVNDVTNSSTKSRTRVDEARSVPSEPVTNIDPVASTDLEPTVITDESLVLTKENVDYPDTRISLQLDSPLKQSVNKNGKPPFNLFMIIINVMIFSQVSVRQILKTKLIVVLPQWRMSRHPVYKSSFKLPVPGEISNAC